MGAYMALSDGDFVLIIAGLLGIALALALALVTSREDGNVRSPWEL